MDFKIAVLPGDGIGPEIIDQAKKVIEAVGIKFNHKFNFKQDWSGPLQLIKRGISAGRDSRPCRSSDAVLFGAIGDPNTIMILSKSTSRQGLLAMRKELGLYANVRPVSTLLL